MSSEKFDWEDDGYYRTDRRDNRSIFWVMLFTMLLNFAATAVKITAGVMTGALSVVADGLDSLFDGLSHITGFAGLYAASKPPDAEHPYGHRKFETIAALSIAFLLFITTWQLLESAWQRLQNPQPPEVNLWVVGAMIISMLIQAGTAWYEYHQGRRLNSEWLVVDSYHTRASILVSASVLVGLGLVRLGFPAADPILAAFVAIMIAKIGVDILRETLPVLVDRAPVNPRRIAEVAASVPGVVSYHRVRSRGTQDSAAVDLHVRVSPDMTVQQANAIGDEVRRRLLAVEGINDVTVHLEPQRTSETNAAEIYHTLQMTASGLGLRVHEAWTHRIDGRLYLETHLGVDPCLTLGEAHVLVDKLEHELRHCIPELSEVHTHIEMATNKVQEGEPASPDQELNIHREIEQIVAAMDGVCNPHQVQVYRLRDSQEDFYVTLECNLVEDLPVSEAHQLSSQIEHELSRRVQGIVDVFVHLEPPSEAIDR